MKTTYAPLSLLGVLVLGLTLGGCKGRQSKLPAGINYYPESGSTVIINKSATGWRILVNGEEMTSASGLLVATDPTETVLDIRVDPTVLHQPIPAQFRLSWSLDGVVRCLAEPACPSNMQTWSRVEVR